MTKPSLDRDRSLLLMDALAEVLGTVSLDVENVLIFASKNDAGGVLYCLNAVLARVRLAQQIGRDIRQLRFPHGRDIDEAIAAGADAYHEERVQECSTSER